VVQVGLEPRALPCVGGHLTYLLVNLVFLSPGGCEPFICEGNNLATEGAQLKQSAAVNRMQLSL
jgi:hypothetical protein